MQFPKQGLQFRLASKGAIGLMTIALPLLISHNAAQANDFYYRNNRYPESSRWQQHRQSAPSIIFQIPLQQHSTQSQYTTILQNGQVIRIYEDHNTYGNFGGNQGAFYPQRRSVEFSIGNQGEFRQVERFPLSPWNQPSWNRPVDQSYFRYGFPNRHHRRW
jgi:hypothetical protein